MVEGAAGDVRGERTEGFFGGLALDVRDVVLGGVPDVFDGVVVGCVRWQVNRRDAFQRFGVPHVFRTPMKSGVPDV